MSAGHIEQMIFSGELAPGQRLIEPDLSNNLNVARGRVREALRILAGSGLIELIPQRGARVAEMPRGDIVSVIEALAAVVLKGMEIFGVRHRLPEQPVANAVLAAMARIQRAQHMAGAPLHRATIEYHVLINHLSGNLRLNTLVSRLGVSLYERKLGDMMGPSHRADIVNSYQGATDLLLGGKSEAAVALLDSQVRLLIERVESGL
ncbi:DNA-binding transcriptional regulator, GntR family [Sphingobium faniae]|nr:DNA-binding transcriptional regulator, GntR family [Sphingobium faniae]